MEHQPTVLALAREIGLRQRSLEYAFRKVLGMTPIEYLLLYRLNTIRRSLQLANPGETTVSKVASQHGVTELGRFAGRYQTLFGESPSATLRTAYRAPEAL